MRNPNTARVLKIADEFASRLRQAVPNCQVELGGSLRSNTMLVGHQDIDLKVLVPQGQDNEAGIRAISAAIAEILPFEKVRLFGSKEEGDETFAVVHQLELDDPIAGSIEVECLVCRGAGYVGFAKLQAQLPAWILDAYVEAKWAALQTGDKAQYKAVKAEFYALTRALYRSGYFAEGK